MREEASSVNGSPSKSLSKDDMHALFDTLSADGSTENTRTARPMRGLT